LTKLSVLDEIVADMKRALWLSVVSLLAFSVVLAAADRYEYKVLATNRTGTMEKEMNQAADAGFSFRAVMGGETGFGGKEVVVVMARGSGEASSRKKYKLLATSRTSTMEKELRESGDAGFLIVGMSVGKTAFGGNEVVSILKRVE